MDRRFIRRYLGFHPVYQLVRRLHRRLYLRDRRFIRRCLCFSISCSVLTLCFGIFAWGFLASLGPRNVYKDKLDSEVSPNDHVIMNHQKQTPNKWHMRPCSLHSGGRNFVLAACNATSNCYIQVNGPIMNTNMRARAKVNPGQTIHALGSRFRSSSLQNMNGAVAPPRPVLPDRPATRRRRSRSSGWLIGRSLMQVPSRTC
jgi:hypothetical protein